MTSVPPNDDRARDRFAHVPEEDLDAFADALVSVLLSAAANLEREAAEERAKRERES